MPVTSRIATTIALTAALFGASCHGREARRGGRPPTPARPSATPAPRPTPAAHLAPAGPSCLPDSVHWVRNAAEYRAAVRQSYFLATDRIERLSQGRRPGTWAVVTDADETLIENSEYQKGRAELGGGFTTESWRAWVAKRSAPALPGAPEFTRRVRELGGKLIVVTNRDEIDCPATEATLRADGIAVDAVLCRTPGAGPSKQSRFDAVIQGRTGKALPPLATLLWVGDNILDFPGLSQDSRLTPQGLAGFADQFVLIPNPMYGSWEQTPRQ